MSWGKSWKWRETVNVCDRDMEIYTWVILPGICHMTGHGKRPHPYDRAWKKTRHILGITAHIPGIELYILSIYLNRDIPWI
jgi:hypothetical protein